MSKIFHLVYRSEAIDLDKAVIREILIKARKYNQEHFLSGVLIYRQGKFVQLLEGDIYVVKSLYKLIKADKRHSKVKILLEINSDERIYGDWSMAFVDERVFRGSTDCLFELFDTAIGKKIYKSESVILLLKKFLRESLFLEKKI
jgi:hypothetical protein